MDTVFIKIYRKCLFFRGGRRGDDQWTQVQKPPFRQRRLYRGGRRGDDQWTRTVGLSQRRRCCLRGGRAEGLTTAGYTDWRRNGAAVVSAEADAAMINGHDVAFMIAFPTPNRGGRRGDDQWTPQLHTSTYPAVSPRRPTRR